MELKILILMLLKDGPVERSKLGGLLFLLSKALDEPITDKGRVIDPIEFLEDLEEQYEWEEMKVKLKNGYVIQL